MILRHTFQNISNLTYHPLFSPQEVVDSVSWSIAIKKAKRNGKVFLETYLHFYGGEQTKEFGQNDKIGVRLVAKKGVDMLEYFNGTWKSNELAGPLKTMDWKTLMEEYAKNNSITVECYINHEEAVPDIVHEYDESIESFKSFVKFTNTRNRQVPAVVSFSIKHDGLTRNEGTWIEKGELKYKIEFDILQEEDRIMLKVHFSKNVHIEMFRLVPRASFRLYRTVNNKRTHTPFYRLETNEEEGYLSRLLYQWGRLRDYYTNEGILRIEMSIDDVVDKFIPINLRELSAYRTNKLIVKDTVFYANKEMLTTHSQYFHDLFKEEKDEYETDIIEPKEFERIYEIINFRKTDDAHRVTVTDLADILKLARVLQMTYLRNDCIRLFVKAPLLAKRAKWKYLIMIGLIEYKDQFAELDDLSQDLSYVLEMENDMDKQMEGIREILKITT